MAHQGNGYKEPHRSAERATTTEPLFKVSNHHTAASGQPPAMEGDTPRMYVGYFANEHGEQAIFVYDRETGEATVRMGDAGWESVYRVEDGRVPGLNVTEAEATWLRACWLATRRR